MKPLVVACDILEDEANRIVEKHSLQNTLDWVWLEDSLHNVPKKLTERLQGVIDEHPKRDLILFAYGNCGNGLIGLTSPTSRLVIPRYNDCISIFLHKKKDLDKMRTHTYFLTRGWLDGSMNLDKERKYTEEKYGKERGDQILKMLYEHYKTLLLIDTDAYDVEKEIPRLNRIAEGLDLEPKITKGDTTILEDLLLQKWEDNSHFVIINPGEKSKLDHFYDF